MSSARETDTLAATAIDMPVWRGAGYSVVVRVSVLRPYGFTVDTVVAAPFRPGTAPRPTDSLFISWGRYCVKGPCPGD